jgi:dynein heavy chain
MYTKLKAAFDEIKKILCETYEPFVFDRLEIQKVWFRYVQNIDAKIEESFKKAVKNSLLDLQRVVGDDKINPIPIFKLSVELENNQLEFRPSTDYLI